MKYDYIVAANGQGDFTTIQEALSKSSNLQSRLRRLFRKERILVLPGVYPFVEVQGVTDKDARSDDYTFFVSHA